MTTVTLPIVWLRHDPFWSYLTILSQRIGNAYLDPYAPDRSWKAISVNPPHHSVGHRTREDAERALEGAVLAVGVADSGWALVPREPTPEAVAAWWRVKNGHHFAGEPAPADTSDYAAYRALVRAASGGPVSAEAANARQDAAVGEAAPTDPLIEDIKRLRKAVTHLLTACPESQPDQDPHRSDARRYGETMLRQSHALAGYLAKGPSPEAAGAARFREALRTMLREYDDNADNEHGAVVHPAMTIIGVRALLEDADRAARAQEVGDVG